MLMNVLLIFCMQGDPTFITLYPLNEVLLASRVYTKVVEFGVCIALMKVGDPGGMSLAGMLQNREPHDMTLKSGFLCW
jgi:hypothetical protein